MTNPLVHPHAPKVALAAGCTLGEGPVWDHRTGRLLFVDIKEQTVWRFDPASGASSRIPVPEPVGFVALTAEPEVVVAGLRSGLARLDLKTGRVTPLVDPEPDKPENRINDGHVGPDGSLYFGTMHERESDPTGAFWHWDGRDLASFHDGITVTNGPAVSHDGQTLYTVDSVRRFLYAHALDDGWPGEAQRFARFEPDWGYPDGLAVDAEGHLWVCHWGGGRITRFAPDGSVERIVPFPTAQVTKCAFGGEDLSTLYVTTAARGLDRAEDTMAGHLFAVRTDVKGLPANICAGIPTP